MTSAGHSEKHAMAFYHGSQKGEKEGLGMRVRCKSIKHNNYKVPIAFRRTLCNIIKEGTLALPIIVVNHHQQGNRPQHVTRCHQFRSFLGWGPDFHMSESCCSTLDLTAGPISPIK